MGRTCYDKKYHTFNEGDEVYTTKPNWRAISPHKPYTVLKCYTPPGYVDDYPVKVIEIVTDLGFISKYATDKFLKTDRQLRQDRIGLILNEIC